MTVRNRFPPFDEVLSRRLQTMKEAENRFLSQRKATQEDCDCKEGMFASLGRRGLDALKTGYRNRSDERSKHRTRQMRHGLLFSLSSVPAVE